MADEHIYNNLLERLAAKLLPPTEVPKPVKGSAEEEIRAQIDELRAQMDERVEQQDATVSDLANSPDVPEVIPFLGIRGDLVWYPGSNAQFRMVYLDVSLQDWLLVENRGIRDHADVEDRAIPGQTLQLMWVDVNAAVGRGHGPQSVEARFLTGEFTRAADFEGGVSGGTGGGTNTGDFCMARTPTCCRYPSRPPRPH